LSNRCPTQATDPTLAATTFRWAANRARRQCILPDVCHRVMQVGGRLGRVGPAVRRGQEHSHVAARRSLGRRGPGELELADRESPGATGSVTASRFPPHTRSVSGAGPQPVSGCLPDEPPPLGLCAPTFASARRSRCPACARCEIPLLRGRADRRGCGKAIGSDVAETSSAPWSRASSRRCPITHAGRTGTRGLSPPVPFSCGSSECTRQGGRSEA
jgi:hypothetical protein